MASVPDQKVHQQIIQEAARGAVLEFCVPWRLDTLRAAAYRGVCRMLDEGPHDLGLGPHRHQQAWKWAQQEARRVAEGLRQSELAGEKPEPSDSQIKEALKVFSADEWCELVGGLEVRGMDALLRYLQDNLDEAANILGVDKCRRVFNAASERRLILGFEALIQPGYKTVVPTDPMWAAFFWRRAREANLRHQPRSKKRTSVESGSYSGIADSLSLQGRKVHGVQVRRWLDRLREYPEWRDFLDRRGPQPEVDSYFWHKIVDPRGYERRWRPLEQDRD